MEVDVEVDDVKDTERSSHDGDGCINDAELRPRQSRLGLMLLVKYGVGDGEEDMKHVVEESHTRSAGVHYDWL